MTVFNCFYSNNNNAAYLYQTTPYSSCLPFLIHVNLEHCGFGIPPDVLYIRYSSLLIAIKGVLSYVRVELEHMYTITHMHAAKKLL